MPPPIPTNLITGFLGVGKTTAVLDLLRRKNPTEKWAVLVNEYGSVSIDDAFIEGEAADGVSVRSVAGGCFCCTTAPMLPVALHFLLQDVRPDRLLIETSGLGHPARLVDTVRVDYADRLELKATVGIVTPSDFAAPGMTDSNPVFRDQVQMSDVLVLNKADTATPELVRDFQTWANALYPPKLLIAATTNGRLEEEWLDLSGRDEVPVTSTAYLPPPPLTGRSSTPQELAGGGPIPQPPPSRLDSVSPTSPSRGEVERQPVARGWVFPLEITFDEPRLLAVLRSHPEITRLKGVFRTINGWIAVNRRDAEASVRSTAYRRDSRVEVFATGLPGWWSGFEAELLACRVE